MKACKKIVSLLLTLCLMVGLLPTAAFAADEPLIHLALGDSISTGYGVEESERFTSKVAAHYGLTEVNRAVNGATATDLRNTITGGTLDEDIASASLITLTIGGNEIVDILCNEIANQYNAAKGTSITGDDVVTMLQEGKLMSMILYIKRAIDGFSESEEFKTALKTYTEDMTAILTYVREKNDFAQVVVCNQFNPYKKFQNHNMLKFAYTEVDKAVVALNKVIQSNSTTLNYIVADVYTPFMKSTDNLFPGGTNINEVSFVDFHPNAAGHAVMADVVNKLNLTITPPPTKEEPLPFEPGVPAVYFTAKDVDLEEGSVEVKLNAMDGEMSVIAAFYNDGKIVGIACQTPAADAAEITLETELRDEATEVSVFLLDGNFAPLMTPMAP